MRDDQNQIFCSQIYNKCLKNSALWWKSILAIIIAVLGFISFFFPNIALLFRQSLHWQTTAFETSDIHIHICLNSAIYMLRCRSLSHPLYIYAAMILNNPPMVFWGCIHIGCMFSPFSNWLLDNLLFLRANLIHLFLEANCIEFF